MIHPHCSVIASAVRPPEATFMADVVLTANHSNLRGCVEANQ